MSLEEYFGEWNAFIDKNILSSILSRLDDCPKDSFLPAQNIVLKLFKMSNPWYCRVMMLGPEPYREKEIHTGIAFASRKGSTPDLEVLKNACMDMDYPDDTADFDDFLLHWLMQGVYPVNCPLTVPTDTQEEDHFYLWQPFLSDMFCKLSSIRKDIIWIIFGRKNLSFKMDIRNSLAIFEEDLPSRYAEEKKDMPGRIFTETNRILDAYGKKKIKWWYRPE